MNRTLASSTEIVSSRTARRVIGALAFAMATAFGAKVAVPLPGGVPLTFQVLAVILSGAILGPRLGAASQMLYVAVGAMGAPIYFAGGGLAYLLGPTGGYLFAFPVAAFIVGKLAGGSSDWRRLALALTAGVAVILTGGFSWLAVATGEAALAFRAGVLPFLWNDVIEIGLALVIARRLRPRALELF